MQALWLGALLLACLPFAAHAQVYRCTAADGSVAYQDHACARGQQQKVMDLTSHAPTGYVPPAPASAPPVQSASPVPAANYVAPAAPLTTLYACVGAVNGKHYLTLNPPPPYLAPLGVMGYPPQTLSQAYGAPGGAGMSAPGGAPKPRVGGPRIAAGMTEVQDLCAPARRAEVCGWLQRQYDANHRKLRMAMPHEQPPYEQREQQLQDQLRNCR